MFRWAGTPLDFAYQVHTDLGHRTRGAKVNGAHGAARLPAQETAKTVEIITAKDGAAVARLVCRPSRAFSPVPGTAIRLRAWFPQAERDPETRRKGRAHVRSRDTTLRRQQPAHPGTPQRAEIIQHGGAARSLGGWARSAPAQGGGGPSSASSMRARRSGRNTPLVPRVRRPSGKPDIEVQGRRRFAVPPTRALLQARAAPNPSSATSPWAGASAFMHSPAPNLARLSIKSPARVLAVAWGKNGLETNSRWRSMSRHSIAADWLRDVSAALADDKISIRGMNTVTDKRDSIAHMRIENIDHRGCRSCRRCSGASRQLPNVISARRKEMTS